jgi:hypothetical protein
LGNEEEERRGEEFLRRREEKEALSIKAIFVKRVRVKSNTRVSFDTSGGCSWWKEESRRTEVKRLERVGKR